MVKYDTQKLVAQAAAYEDFLKALTETDFMFPDDVFEPSQRTDEMFKSISDAAKRQNEAAAAQEKSAEVQKIAAEALAKLLVTDPAPDKVAII